MTAAGGKPDRASGQLARPAGGAGGEAAVRPVRQGKSLDLAAAMKRLRKALEARIRADERAERRAARPTARRAALAGYDILALGKLLRPRLERDGRGWRAVAGEIGVTSPDLSRVVNGQQVAAGKVFAICDWLGVAPRRFYLPPLGRRKPAKRRARAAKRFHGKSTETEGLENG